MIILYYMHSQLLTTEPLYVTPQVTQENNFKAESVEITNKKQPCNRIYYSKVY